MFITPRVITTRELKVQRVELQVWYKAWLWMKRKGLIKKKKKPVFSLEGV